MPEREHAPTVVTPERRDGQKTCDHCGRPLSSYQQWAECSPCRNDVNRFYQRDADTQIAEGLAYDERQERPNRPTLSDEQRERKNAKARKARAERVKSPEWRAAEKIKHRKQYVKNAEGNRRRQRKRYARQKAAQDAAQATE